MEIARHLRTILPGLLLLAGPASLMASNLELQLRQLKTEFVRAGKQLNLPSVEQGRLVLGFTEKTAVSLDEVTLFLSGSQIYSHRYTPAENAALRQGGLQTLEKVSLPAGEQQLMLEFAGVMPDGKAFKEQVSFTLSKSPNNALGLIIENGRDGKPSLWVREF